MVKLTIYPKTKSGNGWLSGNPIKLEFPSLQDALEAMNKRSGKFTYSITGDAE